MKILVDAIPMTGLLTGISRYLRNMYGEMAKLEQADISYLAGKTLVEEMPPLAETAKWEKATAAVWKLPDPVVFCLRSAHWLRYEQILRRVCHKKTFDIYHETAFVPAKQSAAPTVYSVYDLSLRRYRQTHPRERVWFFEYFLKRRLSYADHILTISEFIRQEIIEEFKLPPEMVSSVPLAADPVFGPISPSEVARVLKAYQLPSAYLLFVGSLEPRKNAATLIEAMQKLTTDIPLVMVGWHAWGSKDWLEEAKRTGLSARIKILGHVPDEDLAAIYNGATALVYPSLYEGFGLPILEAMSCGCPVVSSNVASMPEVAGDAALLINPLDSDELTAAIDKVTTDSNLRADLINLGYRQAQKFNWKQTAENTLAVYKKVAAKQ